VSSPPLIELQRITHRYGRHSAPAVVDIDFRAARGERVAIIGRSGCGKSTLLQILAGLVSPTVGAIRVATRPGSGKPIRRTLMFQRPLLFPWLNVEDNIAMALRFDGRGHEARSRVGELLALVGLDGRGPSDVRELSGGQQQRAALARSLAVDPDMLLLDEPFSALDPVTRGELRRELRDLQSRLGVALVLVTHDVDDALDLAERVVVMAAEPGCIVGEYVIPQAISEVERIALRARLIHALEPEPISYAVGA